MVHLALLVLTASPACVLTTSLSGFSSGAPSGDDAGDASLIDAPLDGAATYESCAAAKFAIAGATSGVYAIRGGDAGGSFAAYCDMVNDGGGWMLVTPELVRNETQRNVTVTKTMDTKGGLVLRVYANGEGCQNESTADGHPPGVVADPLSSGVRGRHRVLGDLRGEGQERSGRRERARVRERHRRRSRCRPHGRDQRRRFRGHREAM